MANLRDKPSEGSLPSHTNENISGGTPTTGHSGLLRIIGTEDVPPEEDTRLHTIAARLGCEKKCTIFGGDSVGDLQCLGSEADMHVANIFGNSFCFQMPERKLEHSATLAGQLGAICAKVSLFTTYSFVVFNPAFMICICI